MIVCLCNALTDSQLNTRGAPRPSAHVYAACDCRAQCGTCARSAVAMMRGAGLPEPELLGAD